MLKPPSASAKTTKLSKYTIIVINRRSRQT